MLYIIRKLPILKKKEIIWHKIKLNLFSSEEIKYETNNKNDKIY